jgi:hypothetical protein
MMSYLRNECSILAATTPLALYSKDTKYMYLSKYSYSTYNLLDSRDLLKYPFYCFSRAELSRAETGSFDRVVT